MKLWSDGFADGARIPEKYALGRPHPDTHVQLSENLSPPLAWSDVPANARSLVLIAVDIDVPSRGDDVNKEGRTVAHDLPRVDFFHWVLVDLPPSVASFAEGEWSRGVTAKGKPGPETLHGARHGLNDYTGWFASDADMGGQWFGYDGPGPPWNDEHVHRYTFTLFATDLERCPVEGAFTGAEVRKAIEGHVLAEARWSGRYAIYPQAR